MWLNGDVLPSLTVNYYREAHLTIKLIIRVCMYTSVLKSSLLFVPILFGFDNTEILFSNRTESFGAEAGQISFLFLVDRCAMCRIRFNSIVFVIF